MDERIGTQPILASCCGELYGTDLGFPLAKQNCASELPLDVFHASKRIDLRLQIGQGFKGINVVEEVS